MKRAKKLAMQRNLLMSNQEGLNLNLAGADQTDAPLPETPDAARQL
jgi:hypothetical protein